MDSSNCNICESRYKNEVGKVPRSLQCGHTFCEDCLKRENNLHVCSECGSENFWTLLNCPIIYALLDCAENKSRTLNELNENNLKDIIKISDCKMKLCQEVLRIQDLDKVNKTNIRILEVDSSNKKRLIALYEKVYDSINKAEMRAYKNENNESVEENINAILERVKKEEEKTQVRNLTFCVSYITTECHLTKQKNSKY